MAANSDNIPTVYGDGGPLAPVPDDLTVPQFLFDSHHPLGAIPQQARPAAWFIDDDTGREVTGDELRARVWGVANAMHMRWGMGNDDVVCIYSPNHMDYPVVLWATHRVGGIVTGANPAYTVDELVYQLQITKTRLLFVSPDTLQAGLEAARITGIPGDRVVLFDAVPGASHISVNELVQEGLAQPKRYVEPRLKPGEGKKKIALLFFSSGTTGKPKAVMIPHHSVIANTLQMRQYCDRHDADKPIEKKTYAPRDRMLGMLPFYHIYGVISCMHFFIFSGGTVVVVPRFNFENMLKSIERYKIAHIALVPPMVVLMCKHPAVKNYDLSSIKTASSAAAPLSPELTLQLARLLPHSFIGQGYGMTETCTSVTFPQLFSRVGTPGSAGVLVPGTAVRIRKEDGTWAKAGEGESESGELVVTSPSVALGYLDNPEETAATFKDGWVYTGDVGYVTKDKDLFIIDRIKELIKVRGFQVAPAELEGILLDHPDVADVCVVGAPDEYSGELPFAFVALKDGVRARVAKDAKEEQRVCEAIIKYVADNKTQYKWLAGVQFIDAIPKIPSGKLLRRVLRDRLKELLLEGKIKLVQPGAKGRAKL
ncbi:acetyl-CoA synthetase-like protein [Pilatotrama ljubarskyi]|nr:acetyl-CoA synthetase-like protein [Pilatotrama ljubarskyi]